MVAPDCVIEEGVHLCFGCVVKGENWIERLSKVDTGVVIAARSMPINQA
jgi:UDP-3-O-[3-hydroxymyristoyl] glucosamine N-acyltransferase